MLVFVALLELCGRQSTRGSVEGAAPVRGVVFATLVRLAVILRQNTCLVQVGVREKEGREKSGHVCSTVG